MSNKLFYYSFLFFLTISTTAHNNILKDTLILRDFEKKFQSNYQGNSFDYQIHPPVKTSWDDFKVALVRFINSLFNLSNNKVSLHSVELFFKIIVAIIMMVVIYLLVKAIMNKDGKWVFGKNSDNQSIETLTYEENIHTINFEELISQANIKNDYKLATRFYFLWLLKKLADKQIIDWHIDKTNLEYRNEIQNGKIKKDFSYLVYLYDYIWYGDFEITQETYIKTKNAFETTFQII